MLCKWVLRTFGALFLVALFLLLIGTFGLLGQERDPLAGVFLMPLGLPWVLWLDGLPNAMLPFLAALAPMANLAILAVACRYLTAPRRRRPKL